MGAPKGTVPWNKGKSRNVTWGAAISAATRGKPKSAEHRRKISEANKGRTNSPEVRQKMSQAMMGRKPWNKGKRKATHPELADAGHPGEQHWNWKGGISSDNIRLRQSSEYKAWRDAVFARDDFTCVMCGHRGGYLEADHIKRFADHPHLRLETENGRTLCKPCHSQVTRQQRKADAA